MPFDLATAKRVTGFDLASAQPVSPAPATPAEMDWADVPVAAISNLPSSAGRFAKGIYEAVRHPVDTAENVGKVIEGGLRKIIPGGGTRPEDPQEMQARLRMRNVDKAEAVGQFFKDRYGSEQGFKQALATDPVGVASDAAAVLSGGAGLTGKVGLSSLSGGLQTASKAINPLSAVGYVAKKAAPMVGAALANAVSGLGTRTGAETIRQAFNAGRKGGQTEKSLVENMRGEVPLTDVLDDARANIADMGRAKSAEYRNGMAQVSNDKTVLDFQGIDKAVADAASDVSFKGHAKNAKAAAVQKAIADEVANWKSLDPAEYHTPEGLDALKQRIGGIVEGLPFEERSARRIGDNIYNAVKAEIVKQAPVYADTMKAYSEATEQIREIERALSLGKKAAADTAMRKLQSLTRNNVNTNFGNRLELAQQMEQQGGREIMPALSGQALNTWTPRGLGGAVGLGTGGVGYLAGGLPVAAATMALQSPRLMGEAALAAGRAARAGDRYVGVPLSTLATYGISPANIGNNLSQAGRLSDLSGGQR